MTQVRSVVGARNTEMNPILSLMEYSQTHGQAGTQRYEPVESHRIGSLWVGKSWRRLFGRCDVLIS